MAKNRKIQELYKDLPQPFLDRLNTFRQTYPYRDFDHRGLTWPYIDSQEGAATLFLFAGGTNVAEVSFQSIEHFAGQYRVVAPDYPPVGTIDDLFSGYIALIDDLGIEQFHVMGGSYGGWIAQSFVRRFPDRVDKLVLTAIGPPNPDNSRQLARLLPWLRIAPSFLIRSLINRTFSRLVSRREDSDDMALLWALVQEVVHYRLKKDDFIASMERLIDQTENETFSPDDLLDWPGRILILFGSEDPATPPEKREVMESLYPEAEIVTFEGGEHGIALTHQEQYFSCIDQFLAESIT
jgi:pimeloyl-ACP methyl ester carboxylesterase